MERNIILARMVADDSLLDRVRGQQYYTPGSQKTFRSDSAGWANCSFPQSLCRMRLARDGQLISPK